MVLTIHIYAYKRGGIHFFIAKGQFLVDFYGYTGGPFVMAKKSKKDLTGMGMFSQEAQKRIPWRL